MYGLMMLSESVGKEKRPLSWMIGPQGVIKPEVISMKEEKREERKKNIVFTSPDQI
jgi:NADH-quinone oxidoreductase subunit B